MLAFIVEQCSLRAPQIALAAELFDVEATRRMHLMRLMT
jgi:hypothetical protein